KALDAFRQEEEQMKGQLEQAGKDYTQQKYLLERDVANNKADIARLQEQFEDFDKQCAHELNRLNEEKVATQISFEKQKSALTDLYEEQRRHVLVTREKLISDWSQVEDKLKTTRIKYLQELEKIKQENDQQLTVLREQVDGKKQGWQLALETMKRDFEAMAKEKGDLEGRLSTVRADKEKEVESARINLQVAKEQLEIDKATLVEKAEEDRKRCEADVGELKEKIEAAEKELQDLVVEQEQKKKDTEESFQREESILKETVKNETEKRDYEQKLYQQEKVQKEKELARLREEYEKKKWHWENQLRTLMMRKGVQEAEHDADRMRVDREARAAFRSLEAKRDELRQRLADLKGRHAGLLTNSGKEQELLKQRWHWRKDRLWTMWQNRLEVIKKERETLSEQLATLDARFSQQQRMMMEEEGREDKRIEDLQQYLIQLTDRNLGHMKQREIQNELEKTRIIAQIKECEALISDWMDRLRLTQVETSRKAAAFGEEMNFLDLLYREEERQTELFLHSLQKAMTTLQGCLPEMERKRDAA
ncbi:MAG: hypothetical protein LHV69_10785, partial [Elusimicrobia bacterium]|nr:hypothetical protein [Candidatus Obscuribacterium magneticum]